VLTVYDPCIMFVLFPAGWIITEPPADLIDYADSLLARFNNHSLRHRLHQIAMAMSPGAMALTVMP